MTLRRLLRRFAGLVNPKRRESEIDQELRFHLETEADEQIEAGNSAGQARRAARLDLGNVALIAEETRAAWRWTTFDELRQDLRYGIRTLANSRAFTATAVFCLALGIGANTLLYSLTDAILLRQLPVPEPQRLVRMTWRTPEPESHGTSRHASSIRSQTAGYTNGTFSYDAFKLFVRHTDIFSSVFAYQGTARVSVTIGGETTPATGEYVSGSYFSGLGIVPAAGRSIGPDDDRMGAQPVVMITTALANSRFGGAQAAVGQTVHINNTPFVITGVVPGTFFGTDPGVTPDLYVPLHSTFTIEARRPVESLQARFNDPGEGWLEIMARLRPGVTLERAQAQLAPPFQEFTNAVKASGGKWEQAPALVLVPGGQGIDGLRRGYSTPLLLLTGLAALILLVACSNIANLLLARSAARAREIALRMSLGAARARIVRQLLTESLLLAMAGGFMGVGIAVLGVPVVTSFLTNGRSDFALHADLNWRVLLFAVGLSIATSVVFGLVPAIRSTRRVALGLREARTTPVTLSSARGGLTRAIVVFQMGATLVLLVVAGLFARTLASYAAVDLGFNPNNVLTVTMNAGQTGLDTDAALGAYAEIQRRLALIPGVVAVGSSESALLGDGGSAARVWPVDRVFKASVPILNIGPGFFSTMQVPLVRGREIGEADNRAGARPVVVVSRAYAQEFFGDENALGRFVKLPGESERIASLRFEVVGVAADVRYGRLLEERPPVVYIPFSHLIFDELGAYVFEIRTPSDPTRYEQPVRQIVRQVNAGIPIIRVATQEALIDRLIATPILLARLCLTFALLALVIAVVGLYGTVTYEVTRRTPEIGVRMALGARPGQIIGLVLRNVFVLVAAGVAVGVPGAFYASTFAKTYLFGVTGGDPATMILATSVLIVAALAAAYVPARAAARLNPTTVIRAQ